ncbi:Spermatogenesis-defective protein 39 [Portunus trituberculatus]|uniref:Spermatogenesis-defective protein 39 n=1 Tax=Portunus trituberculatus TaxID=210409 RepID=A0A5B7CWN7_PORTR|nr:Spermatogenesis-defective protein 39 [Portunus trituberculatus]
MREGRHLARPSSLPWHRGTLLPCTAVPGATLSVRKMNRAENDAYWGSTDTAPPTLDNFFDEDCEVTWTGITAEFSKFPQSGPSKTTPDGNSSSSGSIVDNITVHSVSDWNYVEVKEGRSSTSSSSSQSVSGVGKAIGDKLESWKPPSVSIKWNSSQGSGPCVQCAAKDTEIVQLKKRLENSYSRYNLTLPPDDTINRIILGQPYSLESYRSLEDKLALLDTALSTMDGSAILATILHLKNTVKKTIFTTEMQARQQACTLYTNYLRKRHKYSEAIEFLRSLGKPEEAAILSYELALTGKTPEARIKNMEKSLETHFVFSSVSFEAKMVKSHMKLLERQMAIDEVDSKDQTNSMLLKYPRAANVVDKSLLTTLFYCCMYHWEAGEGHVGSPLALRKAHDLTDRELLWTALKGRARVNHWPLPSELDSWLGSKGLLGALGSLSSAFGSSGKILPKGIKATLPIEAVVHTLHGSGAPSNVLAVYIDLLDNVESRLKLAHNYKCHQAVIDIVKWKN